MISRFFSMTEMWQNGKCIGMSGGSMIYFLGIGSIVCIFNVSILPYSPLLKINNMTAHQLCGTPNIKLRKNKEANRNSASHPDNVLHGGINPVNKLEKAWHAAKQSAVEVEKVRALYAGIRLRTGNFQFFGDNSGEPTKDRKSVWCEQRRC